MYVFARLMNEQLGAPPSSVAPWRGHGDEKQSSRATSSETEENTRNAIAFAV